MRQERSYTAFTRWQAGPASPLGAPAGHELVGVIRAFARTRQDLTAELHGPRKSDSSCTATARSSRTGSPHRRRSSPAHPASRLRASNPMFSVDCPGCARTHHARAVDARALLPNPPVGQGWEHDLRCCPCRGFIPSRAARTARRRPRSRAPTRNAGAPPRRMSGLGLDGREPSPGGVLPKGQRHPRPDAPTLTRCS
jgi:hypothetical protein